MITFGYYFDEPYNNRALNQPATATISFSPAFEIRVNEDEGAISASFVSTIEPACDSRYLVGSAAPCTNARTCFNKDINLVNCLKMPTLALTLVQRFTNSVI
jgi:hypothetical protein